MELQLSAGSIDITPPFPIPLFGFAERLGAFSKVHDPLEVNLSALKQGDKLFLVYSVDTLFVPEDFVKLILEKFGAAHGLQEQDIWMTATHTHFAPSLDKEKPGLGKFDEAYYKMVAGKIMELTEQVLKGTYKTVQVKYGKNRSVLNVNRRKKLLRPKKGFGVYNKVLMYPDFHGVKDDNIHVLKLVDDEHNVAMVLWNYACHPVGFVHRSQVTAEFIGVIRGHLREHYKNDRLPVLFLIGFAGNLKPDVTPVTHTRLRDRIRYFFQLGAKHTRFPKTSYYMEWTEMLWHEVMVALENAKVASVDEVSASQHDIPLGDIIGDYEEPVHFKKLRLSKDIVLIGVSAEVLAEYKDIVAKAIKGETIINVGCLAGTRIYLPTDKHVREGGYEVHWFQHRFAIEGDFKKGLDEKIQDTVALL